MKYPGYTRGRVIMYSKYGSYRAPPTPFLWHTFSTSGLILLRSCFRADVYVLSILDAKLKLGTACRFNKYSISEKSTDSHMEASSLSGTTLAREHDLSSFTLTHAYGYIAGAVLPIILWFCYEKTAASMMALVKLKIPGKCRKYLQATVTNAIVVLGVYDP